MEEGNTTTKFYNDHLLKSLGEQLEITKSFGLEDVTLICKGEKIRAHRAVLAASSVFLRELLLDNPCEDCVIVFQETCFQTLQTIIRYLYTGEARLGSEEMPAVMQLAENLQLTGSHGLYKCENGNGLHEGYPDHTSLQTLVNFQTLQDVSAPSTSNMKNSCSYWQSKNDHNGPDLNSSLEDVKPCETPSQQSLDPDYHPFEYLSEDGPIISHDDDNKNMAAPGWQNYQYGPPKDGDEVKYGMGVTGDLYGHGMQESSTMQYSSGPDQTGMNPDGNNLVSAEKENPSSSGQYQGPPKPDPNQKPTERNFKCSQCTSAFFHKKALQNHISNYHRDGTCRYCGKYFRLVNTLRKHVRNEHGSHSFPHECKLCNKFYKNRRSLQTHQSMWHSGRRTDETFPCAHCGQTFKLKQNLMVHEQNSHGELSHPQQCTICEAVLKNERSLKMHMKNTHMGANRSHLCTICGKTFTLKQSLKRHEQRGHGEAVDADAKKLYRCPYCNKGAKGKRALQTHIWVYHRHSQTGQTYPCTKCDKVFGAKLFLERHTQKAHKQQLEQPPTPPMENPHHSQHECPYCRQTFPIHEIQQHIGMHLSSVPLNLTCDYCTTTFENKLTLSYHMQNCHLIPPRPPYYNPPSGSNF